MNYITFYVNMKSTCIIDTFRLFTSPALKRGAVNNTHNRLQTRLRENKRFQASYGAKLKVFMAHNRARKTLSSRFMKMFPRIFLSLTSR